MTTAAINYAGSDALEQLMLERAERVIEAQIERRVAAYRARPSELDMIEPGLSNRSPADLAARIVALLNGETAAPRRWFGFGGEVTTINLQAALRYAGQAATKEIVR